MCTAISFHSDHHYFGRNLDLEYHYQEEVTITPRAFPLPFRLADTLTSHYAMIGMAYVTNNYPLYYDATNEMGLSVAALNFPGNCVYHEPRPGKNNITPFEFIPWILGLCSCLTEAKVLLSGLNLVNLPFCDTLPLSPLHWMISDSKSSVVVESTSDGLKIYDNPIHVLTNNPTFDHQLFFLNNYSHLSAFQPSSSPFGIPLSLYSRGMGGIGLPGDYSSPSRFVRAAFVRDCTNDYNKKMAEKDDSAPADQNFLSQFFHILLSVSTPKGLVAVENGAFQYTIYSSCCNTDLGIYYYITYDNLQIHAIDMHHAALDSSNLYRYPLILQSQISWQL